jgi:hypothetical protein
VRLLKLEKLLEYLKVPRSLLCGSFLSQEYRTPGCWQTFCQSRQLIFLGISKGATLVFPPQKPELGIETGMPEKVTQPSTQCGVVMVNKYVQLVTVLGLGITEEASPSPHP